MNQKYTRNEKEWIIQQAGTLKDKEAVIEFNKITGKNMSLVAYRRLRNRLGVKKKSGRGISEVRNV
jgi:hypothetical protein